MVLLAVSLLSALAVEAVIGESRAALAATLEARAAAFAESAVAAALATRLDSVATRAPPGTRLMSLAAGAADDVRVTGVVLQPGLVLLMVRAVVAARGVRTIAGRRCLALIRPSPDRNGEAQLELLTPNGWLAVP